MPVPKSGASTSVKKPRSRPSQSSRPTKSALSEEFVRDSDNSDSPPAKTAKTSTLKKSQPQKKPSAPVVTSEASKQKLESASQKLKSPSVSTSSLPEEEEITTNTEEESLPSLKSILKPDVGKGSTAQTSPVSNDALHGNGIKPKRDEQRVSQKEATESSTSGTEEDEEEDDDDDDDDEGDNRSDTTDEPKESSKGDQGSEFEEEDEEEVSSKGINLRNSSEVNGVTTHSVTDPFERPRTLFEPPSGFQPATVSFPPSSKLPDILKPSNLEGKQIWYISVRAQAPFHLVQDLSLESLENGNPVFSDGNVDYAASLEDDGENGCTSILIPSPGTNDYRGSTTAISRTLNIRRCLKLPQHILGDHSTSASSAPPQKPTSSTPSKIPQPAGLKMRFRPFGASSESDSEGSSLGGASPSRPHGSTTTEDTSHARKRKHAEISPPDNLNVETPSRKSKKAKQAASETKKQMKTAHHNTNNSSIESHPERTPLKRKAESSPDETPLNSQAIAKRNDKSDDRARRKEEKRRRKALMESTSTPLPPPSAINTTISSHKELSPSKSSKAHSYSKSKSSKPTPATASKPVMSLSEFSAHLTAQEERSNQKVERPNGVDQPASTKKRSSREDPPAPAAEIKSTSTKAKVGGFHTSPFPPMKPKAASENQEEETAEAKAERRRRRKEEKRKAKEDARLKKG